MIRFLTKLIDFLGGLFLVITGSFLLYLYGCLYSKTDNWFMSFEMILFLLGVGIGAIILGFRSVLFTFKKVS